MISKQTKDEDSIKTTNNQILGIVKKIRRHTYAVSSSLGLDSVTNKKRCPKFDTNLHLTVMLRF